MKLESARLPALSIGTVTGVDSNGSPMVRIGEEPSRAAAVVWLPQVPDWQDQTGLRVLLGEIDEAAGTPVIVGLLDAPRAPLDRTVREADVEHITARRELVLECGKAKIAMRADGRIEIRGGHLISRSSGPNKIKGGSVHIN